MGQKYTVRSTGAGPDLEYQFPSLRTDISSLLKVAKTKTLPQSGGKCTADKQSEQKQEFHPCSCVSNHLQNFEFLTIPFGHGCQFFLITERKSPLTIPPTRDPFWAAQAVCITAASSQPQLHHREEEALEQSYLSQILCQH